MSSDSIKTSVMLAISGGVDSSAAAVLLQRAGYDVKAMVLRLHEAEVTPEEIASGKLRPSIWYARETARRLHIHFEIADMQDEFQNLVIKAFAEKSEQGMTPDPCVLCNSVLKIPRILAAADKLECEKIATGHIARVEYDEITQRYILKKGKDAANDQSFVLSRLTQEMLSRLLLPLGELNKEEIRALAASARLKNASLLSSDTVCFMPDGNKRALIEAYHRKNALQEGEAKPISGLTPGDIVTSDKRVVARHEGYLSFNIGRELLIESEPETLYVKEMNPRDNTILAVPRSELYVNRIIISDINFVSVPELKEDTSKFTARLSCEGDEYPVLVKKLEKDRLEITFEKAVCAVSRGQSLVLYDEDVLIACGTVERV